METLYILRNDPQNFLQQATPLKHQTLRLIQIKTCKIDETRLL